MTKKFKGTEEQFRKALLKWLNNKADQLRANVHGDDDTSEWCKDEADLVEQHIQTVESLIFVNDALKASTDEAHRQADMAYARIKELEAKLAKAVDRGRSVASFWNEAIDEALDILDEEGWLGESRERIELLKKTDRR